MKIIIHYALFILCISSTNLNAQNLNFAAPAWLDYILNNQIDKNEITWQQVNTSKISNEHQKTGYNFQGSGRVEALYISNTDTNFILAGSNTGGLFKTKNGGKTWYNITNNAVFRGFPGVGINAIAVNPNNENEILLATGTRSFLDKNYGCGLLESHDGGEHWNMNTTFLNAIYSYDKNYLNKPPIIGFIKFSPFKKGLVMATCYNLVLKSDDYGKTWKVSCIVDLRLTDPNNFKVFKLSDIEYSPNGKTVFITGEDAEMAVNGGTVVLQSDNNGKSWKKIALPKNWQMLKNGNFDENNQTWKVFPNQEDLNILDGKGLIKITKGEKKILYNTTKDGGFAPNNAILIKSNIHKPDGIKMKYLFKNNAENISFEKLWNEEEIPYSKEVNYFPKHSLSCYGIEFDASNAMQDGIIEVDNFLAFPTAIELANVEVINNNIIKILYLERPWRNHLITYDYKKNKVIDDIFSTSDVRLKGLDYVSIDWNYDFAVSKSNPNIIYVGNTLMRKSIDGGKTFKPISVYNSKYKKGDFTHCDVRTFYLLNETQNEDEDCMKKGCRDVLIMGNDGGISKTNNGGDESWINLNGEGFIATQIEGMGVSSIDTNLLSYGAWDNGLNVRDSIKWKYILQSDAFDQEINFNNETLGLISGGNVGDKIQHFNIFSNKLSKSVKKPFEKKHEWKSNSSYNAPLRIFPDNEMYIATQELYHFKNDIWTKESNVYESKIDGKIFNNFLSAFDISIKNDTVYWLVSEKDNDLNSQVWVKYNKKWNNVTNNLPNQFGISAIACNPQKPNIAYVSYMGIKDEKDKNAIFFTENFGKNWIDISQGITPYSINKLLVVEMQKPILFAATDDGMYFFSEKHKKWKSMNFSLPSVVVSDIEYQAQNNNLYISTWGQGIWHINLKNFVFD